MYPHFKSLVQAFFSKAAMPTMSLNSRNCLKPLMRCRRVLQVSFLGWLLRQDPEESWDACWKLKKFQARNWLGTEKFGLTTTKSPGIPRTTCVFCLSQTFFGLSIFAQKGQSWSWENLKKTCILGLDCVQFCLDCNRFSLVKKCQTRS